MAYRKLNNRHKDRHWESLKISEISNIEVTWRNGK
ncbi:unnamed protein product [Paramecium pentaurelia]|uniref:Uncharacterized protein n=1 Tax=Paramecium pentaurelia TaxID=43138 RepID=A0A8S1XNH3_9CILI|nr:unnamed protein product [Paramecium pentaurelia]